MTQVNDLKRERQQRSNVIAASMLRRQALKQAGEMSGQAISLTLSFDDNLMVIEAVQGPDNEPMLKVTVR